MNFTKAQPRVLFFLEDAVPSDEEYNAMEKLLGARVLPRNVAALDINGAIEDADAVAGAVPESYSKYPVVTTYAQARAVIEKNKSKTVPPETGQPAPSSAPKTPPKDAWGKK